MNDVIVTVVCGKYKNKTKGWTIWFLRGFETFLKKKFLQSYKKLYNWEKKNSSKRVLKGKKFKIRKTIDIFCYTLTRNIFLVCLHKEFFFCLDWICECEPLPSSKIKWSAFNWCLCFANVYKEIRKTKMKKIYFLLFWSEITLKQL